SHSRYSGSSRLATTFGTALASRLSPICVPICAICGSRGFGCGGTARRSLRPAGISPFLVGAGAPDRFLDGVHAAGAVGDGGVVAAALAAAGLAVLLVADGAAHAAVDVGEGLDVGLGVAGGQAGGGGGLGGEVVAGAAEDAGGRAEAVDERGG